jgi:putative Holliday junction resolvase
LIALGIDVGKARVGVAYNVGSLVLAHGFIPRGEIAARGIAELAAQKNASQLFVGLPLGLSGDQTPSTKDALLFAREISRHTPAQVLMVDERLTSVSAARALRGAGKSARDSKSIIDAESARVILEIALSGAKTIALEEFDD